MKPVYEKATPKDCELLSETARIAKGHWGYSKELLEQWHDDLTVTPDNFKNHVIYKGFFENDFIGYFSLKDHGMYTELDGMWILPQYHGKGLGTDMILKAKEVARALHYKYIELFADPNADGFYEKCGAKKTGKIPTIIEDRFLNTYHFILNE
ncbi:GNAT family N-acetyltransferase [Chryseobacterium sp.]|uniref:GNAT family N-acetyltransferase n=1 Tax=Chryseobacterium sp. TaxID=1871047 RepID=UPI0025C2F862|nr:GNAT family N-acetyltransferase [Chryseobacterium sp.]MBV8325862.1 GNAT family N-acetyltransferase [Chryseobacterium sp.]